MAEITAALVKELREMTGAGMMECKKALVEADGDMDKAVDVLRTRGLAAAAKKVGRATNEGTVMAIVSDDATKGAVVELNCETDFVGMNEKFKAYAEKIAKGELNLDPAESAVANDRRVRASGGAHPARTVIAGRPLTVLAARVAGDAPADRLGSGAAALIANRLLLGCAEGVLEVTEVKPDGKRAMDASSFAAGVPALWGEEGTWSRA